MAGQGGNGRARRAAARWGRAAVVVIGGGLAVSLAACASNGPEFTAKPVVTIHPSQQPRTATPTSPATSASSDATPTESPTKAAVKATGSLALYGPVSKALSGTCRTADAGPTITLADHDNEFFGTVDLTVLLRPTKNALASIDGALGEDAEGFTWKLSYNADSPTKGTSATLKKAANRYAITGKLAAVETRKGKVIAETIPFTLVATCASADW